jgi:1-phosphofructokinase
MIYTVTFNPSLDYIVTVKDFKQGVVNRTDEEIIFPGGKGINVSIVLKNLGFDSVALGFTAGFTGVEIAEKVKEHGCKTDFIHVNSGISRINVKLKSDEESEINGQGPMISKEALDKLMTKLDQLNEEDILVLAGSIPSSLPEDIYENILKRLESQKIRVVVDATKDLLLNVLKYHPFLIKPNNHELGEMFGVVLNTNEEIIAHAKKLKDMGARNVLISMAGDGAIFITEDDQVHVCKAPKGKVVNSVGAGDSMVAGFLAGYLETNDLLKAFKMGVATGSASAFSEELAKKEEVQKLLETI